MRHTKTTWILLALITPLFSVGCESDQTLIAKPVDAVAVTTGDFDYIAAPLDHLIVDHESYEGLISIATWSDDYDPDLVSLKVEGLLQNEDEINLYDVIMVASGTRGLGETAYNGLDADNQIVADPDTIANVVNYVQRGGILVVTDWSYDLVETCWPDAFTFVEDEGLLDDAQRGIIGTITADIVDNSLATALDMNQLAIDFNFSNWAVALSAGNNTTVHISATAEYLNNVSGTETVVNAPLLATHTPSGATGKVVYSSFHFDAQNRDAMDEIMTTVVATFEESEATVITVGE